MSLIDFHTHILPGIDDGSRDEGMTLAMLKEEAGQGVGLVVATPHFYANRTSMDGFLRRRDDALERTKRALEGAAGQMPDLTTGAEVYYFRGIGKADAVSKLCVGDTRTMLLEMPFEQWTEDVYRDVEQLVRSKGLDIVLAHVERYVEFQKDVGIWDRVMALPLTRQINAGSLLKRRSLFHRDRTRKFCMDLLKEYPDTIIGSDCHNMTSRVPNLALGRAEIERELGAEALRRVDEAVGRALGLRA